MNRLCSFCKIILLIFPLLVCGFSSMAQDNNAGAPPPDEGMDIFLLILAGIFISLMLGAAFAGAFLAAGLLIAAGLLASAGILSVSILISLYKRSLTAGFKTILYLICPVAGFIIGTTGVWLVARLFHHPLGKQDALLLGGTAGLAGGFIMAFVVSKMATVISRYYKDKLSQRIHS